jgi:hypothetical protein
VEIALPQRHWQDESSPSTVRMLRSRICWQHPVSRVPSWAAANLETVAQEGFRVDETAEVQVGDVTRSPSPDRFRRSTGAGLGYL